MKTTVPCNREQERALKAVNKIRTVLGLKERSTIPVSENPMDKLLGNRAEIVRHVILFDKEVLAEKAAEMLRTSTKQVNGRMGVQMPKSMLHFVEKTKKGRYSNLSTKSVE